MQTISRYTGFTDYRLSLSNWTDMQVLYKNLTLK